MKLAAFKTPCILLISLLLISPAFAQSTDAAEKDRPLAQQQEAESQTGEAESEVKNTPQPPIAKPSPKTFKPSEEISEDSPVPFPVDI